jgi:hypothetical protein
VYGLATSGTGEARGEGQYAFTNPGNMGDGSGDSDQHTVILINWRDAMVWTNSLGIFDISGNVYELCFDWLPGFEGSFRVIRGGAWNTTAEPLRVGAVTGIIPYDKSYVTGLRVVRINPQAN